MTQEVPNIFHQDFREFLKNFVLVICLLIVGVDHKQIYLLSKDSKGLSVVLTPTSTQNEGSMLDRIHIETTR